MIVMAASLGGPVAINHVVAGLPDEFPVPLLVVQHRRPTIDEGFGLALRRRTRLSVEPLRDGAALPSRGIRVVPARHTAEIDHTGTARVRPADGYRQADPLITSVAEHVGPRALCVVLTGRLDDGAAGVRALKRHGGRTLVEDPATAGAPEMPSAALATGCVDLVMPLAHIAPSLIALTMAPGAADLFRVPPSPWASLVA